MLRWVPEAPFAETLRQLGKALHGCIAVGTEPRYFPVVACPTPNLGSGAHAAGISEAKGAQPSGRLAAPLRAVPEGA
jgi:hypothetical protein